MRISKPLFTALCIISLLPGTALALNGSDLVKLSRGGICHPAESPYYERVRNTSDIENLTLDGCLEGKGNTRNKNTRRLPKYLQTIWDTQKALANKNTTPEDRAKLMNTMEEAMEKNKEDADAVRDFGGLKFGLGLAATFIDNKISNARVIDGRIVVTERSSTQARAILESHKFIWGRKDEDFGWGYGPFVAAALADDQGQGFLNAFGLGLMAGFRSEAGPASWNIGVGWFVDTDVKRLRKGLSDGMETTVTDSADLLRTVDQDGVMIIVSGTW